MAFVHLDHIQSVSYSQYKGISRLLTRKEFLVCTLRLLDASQGPRIKNLGLHDRRLHEVSVLITGSLPRLLVFDLIQKFFLAPHAWDIALSIL